MSEFLPQSTDRTRDNTNPLLSNVTHEGSVAIPLTLATGFYTGSVTVTLPLDTSYANLAVEAWIRIQISGGGNIVQYRPLTQVTRTSAGVYVSSGSITIASPAKAGTYDIGFTYQTSTSLLITPTIYYRIKSDRVTADGMTFV